ncbi:heterokaryon incompatibility protein-domain-containing protein [Bisporella sp. PMI_857]|nr:heterokaryon incompatibility protein-domain-containing protein [Bisporella sp. PMI_857]
MKLINTTTMELEEFADSIQAPHYAILSHTWGEGEVTFQDFAHPEIAGSKKGYSKIKQTCQRAKARDIGYAWVDTCCIDKTSSAELTEAINSMFQWYACSQVCYVWLADLKADQPIKSFTSCRWFSRGWTLQELIAPAVVEFYDKEWMFRGTKSELSDELRNATGIDREVLDTGTIGVLSTIPLARRMSWASNRITTRQEDTAYCLLGIFGVNMPLLYGEGDKAFIRLQEEIIKESNDLSLFAWMAPSDTDTNLKLRNLSLSTEAVPPDTTQNYHGVLATSPAYFKEADEIVFRNDGLFDDIYVMTNKGLQITTTLASKDNTPVFLLNCSHRRTGNQVAIYLIQYGAHQYARSCPETLALSKDWFIPDPLWQNRTETMDMNNSVSIFLSKHLTPQMSAAVAQSHRHSIVLGGGFFLPTWRLCAMRPASLYDHNRRLFLTRKQASFVGFLVLEDSTPDFVASPVLIVFGVQSGQPWVTITTTRSNTSNTTKLMKNLEKMGEAARQWNVDHIILTDTRTYMEMKVSVVLSETILERQPVYVVDIQCE